MCFTQLFDHGRLLQYPWVNWIIVFFPIDLTIRLWNSDNMCNSQRKKQQSKTHFNIDWIKMYVFICKIPILHVQSTILKIEIRNKTRKMIDRSKIMGSLFTKKNRTTFCFSKKYAIQAKYSCTNLTFVCVVSSI